MDWIEGSDSDEDLTTPTSEFSGAEGDDASITPTSEIEGGLDETDELEGGLMYLYFVLKM